MINNEYEKLSNEELEVLFGQPTVESGEELSVRDRKVVQDTFSESMKSAAFALSEILNKKVQIYSPSINLINPIDIKKDITETAIIVELEYTKGLVGTACIIMLKPQSIAMADILMGGDGKSRTLELNELYLNALNDAISQMIDSANTVLSASIGKTVEMRPIRIKQVDFGREDIELEIFKERRVVKITYRMDVEDLASGEMIQLFPIDLAKDVIERVYQTKTKISETREEVSSQIPKEEGIHPVEFGPIPTKEMPKVEVPSNIKLILDIPMEVSVELGRTKMRVKDILNLGVGSVIELQKLSNEPVDILVNGRLVAKGVVVVVENSFGVRISDILAPVERLEHLP